MTDIKDMKLLDENQLMDVTGGAGNRQDVFIKIEKILRNKYGNLVNINMATHIVDDLGADSLDVVDVVKCIGDRFRFRTDCTMIAGLHTVGDLCNLVFTNLK